jgi:hypothetical protein
MTTCRRDIHSIDYKDCANPDSDWREARITFQSSFSIKTLLADGCGLTSGEGKNTGVCMSWRCDSSVCGGDDPFYAKGQTMLIASEKFYRLERDFSYALQTWLLGTAQVFIQSKSTREIVKLTNSDMTTDRPAWSSNYVETAYAKFDIQETGDYRVIVSLKADNEEGAMFNLMSIEKSFMGSNDLSKFFFAYGTVDVSMCVLTLHMRKFATGWKTLDVTIIVDIIIFDRSIDSSKPSILFSLLLTPVCVYMFVRFLEKKMKKKKFSKFVLFLHSKKDESFCLFPPSRGIPHTKHQRRRRQNSPALSQLPTPSLSSLLSFAHLRRKENGFKERDAS